MLNAFCRVAPSVRFSVRAILAPGVLFPASDFNCRTWSVVQARLFDDLFTMNSLRLFGTVRFAKLFNKINLRACESFAETAARAGTRATDVNAASPCGA